MEVLYARAFLDDHRFLNGMSVEDMIKEVKYKLSSSLAKTLVDKFIDEAIVKREMVNMYQFTPSHPLPGTEYELRAYVLTKDEYKEYQELKEFYKRMRGIYE